MAWIVEYTDEFEAWWVGLDEEEQIDLDAVVGLLEEKGPHLPFPFSSDIKGARYRAIRELRVQHKGKPYRILYAFDPRRAAILLIGGRKTGGGRWYEQYLPLAERIYEDHLKSLEEDQGGGL
ncbi:MAG: type II toxin-antitoxin system RelE/ParE family toxin [Deltaproteobacteria bacterium]|nr:type II toxin-antitoxin system RelE/ParE family toxin [Deltaproteobacteria bacterium]